MKRMLLALASRAPSLAFCIAGNATGGHRNPDPIRFSFENLKAMQRVAIETPTQEAIASRAPSLVVLTYNLN